MDTGPATKESPNNWVFPSMLSKTQCGGQKS